MEINYSVSFSDRIKKIYSKDPMPFTTRREIDWRAIKKTFAICVVGVVLILLIMPSSKPDEMTYHENLPVSGYQNSNLSESNASNSTVNQLEQLRVNVSAVPKNLDYMYERSGSSSSGSGRDKNSSMIVARAGLDAKTQISPGSRIRVKLQKSIIVADTPIPIIGIVSSDYVHEENLAIPKDTKILGEVSFDDSSGRGQVNFRSIQMPDGRERPISALSVDLDGQVGIQGKIHTKALKNVIGQTLSNFVAAYAGGSMERGALGSSPGGSENGLKNALAETAKARADAWAEDLKKEKKWIELSAEMDFFAVLKEPFTFRDPGGSVR